MTERPGPPERQRLNVQVDYARGLHDAFNVRSISLNARKPEPKRGWDRLKFSIGRSQDYNPFDDTERLRELFERGETLSEGEPRSIIARIPRSGDKPESIGYILLDKPFTASDDGKKHVTFYDIAVKKEYQQKGVVGVLMDRLTSFRVDGEPVIYDASATDQTYRMLLDPAVQERLRVKGYSVVDLGEDDMLTGGVIHHKVSLVPLHE